MLTFSKPVLAMDFHRAEAQPTNFHKIINNFQQFATQEAKAIDLATMNAQKLDATKLKLTQNHGVKVYFINEGALYRNQLGLTTTGTTVINQLVFEDITCTRGCVMNEYRSPYGQFGTPDGKPLKIGDYMDLGNISAGTTLDFFLRRDGYLNPDTNTYYTDASLNEGKLQHLIAYDYQNYLVLAWEDLKWGGDRDYNDVIFAVDIGDTNMHNIVDPPVDPKIPPVVNPPVVEPFSFHNPESNPPETPKQDTPKQETPKQDTPKQETPKQETPKSVPEPSSILGLLCLGIGGIVSIAKKSIKITQ